MRWIIRSLIPVIALVGSPAWAGPNLGMKLACKKYGEAWNSGSRGMLMSAVTGDFAQAWARLPVEEFANLPRGGSGQVLGTSKGRGYGVVTVQTSHGVVDFIVVGNGFNWHVADINRRNKYGETISTKEAIHVSCTSKEFMQNFTDPRDVKSYRQLVTSDFLKSIDSAPSDAVARVRERLPHGRPPAPPVVRIENNRAFVEVTAVDQKSVALRFSLANEGGWKVDDMSFTTPTLVTASFKQSLPSLAALSDFGAFVKDCNAVDPDRFVAEGSLNDELSWLADNHRPFPDLGSCEKRSVIVEDNGATIRVATENKESVFTMCCNEKGTAKIASAKVIRDGRTNDLAGLVGGYRKLQQLPGAGVALTRWLGATAEAATVENASATEND